MNGLILTAGGARGAYQAGVLKRIGELSRLQGKPTPFPIVTGASAGAINGAGIAAGAQDFSKATQVIAELWANIRFKDVFKSDVLSLGCRSARWFQELSLGGLIGGGGVQSLLDFSPLRGFLADHIKFDEITGAIENRHLYALAISATSYYSGKAFTFIEGQKGHPLWEKSRRISVSLKVNVIPIRLTYEAERGQ